MRKYGGCRLAEYQWFDKVHGWQDNATIGKLSGAQEPNGFLLTVGTRSCRPKEVFVRLFAEARNRHQELRDANQGGEVQDGIGKVDVFSAAGSSDGWQEERFCHRANRLAGWQFQISF